MATRANKLRQEPTPNLQAATAGSMSQKPADLQKIGGMIEAPAHEPRRATYGAMGLAEAAEQLESSSPSKVLEWAVEAFDEGLTLSLSFGGAEGIVILNMLSRIANRVRIFTLDTGFLFKETQDFREEVMRRYRIPVEIFRPELTVAAQARQHGDRLYARDPDLCCRIRRIEPLKRALEGYEAWITGIRREQTPQRTETPVVGWEERFGVAKIAPLAAWSAQQVEEYIRDHDIPMNPLLKKGYRSIGCEPCTWPVGEGEEERVGRWRGLDKTECGLHWVGNDIKRGGVARTPNRASGEHAGKGHRLLHVYSTAACAQTGTSEKGHE